jgi:hypothetical protein
MADPANRLGSILVNSWGEGFNEADQRVPSGKQRIAVEAGIYLKASGSYRRPVQGIQMVPLVAG